MLNITGGGEEKFKQEKNIQYLKPSLVFDINPTLEDIRKKIEELYKR